MRKTGIKIISLILVLALFILMSSELEKNDIEKIEEVELSFHIYDLSSYETILDTDPIGFTVE